MLSDPKDNEVYAGFWKDNLYNGEGRLNNVEEEEEGGHDEPDFHDLTEIGNSWKQYEGRCGGGCYW